MTQYLVNKMPALDWGEALPWVRECPHREPLWPVARMLDLLGAGECWSCFTGLLHSSIRNYSILCFQHLGSLGRVQLFPLPHMPALPSPLPLPNSPSSHAATAEMRLGPLHPWAKLHKDSVSWLMRGVQLLWPWSPKVHHGFKKMALLHSKWLFTVWQNSFQCFFSLIQSINLPVSVINTFWGYAIFI